MYDVHDDVDNDSLSHAFVRVEVTETSTPAHRLGGTIRIYRLTSLCFSWGYYQLFPTYYRTWDPQGYVQTIFREYIYHVLQAHILLDLLG